jgi:shikimate dehydrogenase
MHETEACALGLPLVYRILDGAVMGYGEADLPRILAMLGHMGFAGSM